MPGADDPLIRLLGDDPDPRLQDKLWDLYEGKKRREDLLADPAVGEAVRDRGRALFEGEHRDRLRQLVGEVGREIQRLREQGLSWDDLIRLAEERRDDDGDPDDGPGAEVLR